MGREYDGGAGEYDPPHFCTSCRVVARKKHTCCECGKAISIGEPYTRDSGKWDGSVTTFKTCRICVDIGSCFDGTYCFTHLADAIEQLDDDDPVKIKWEQHNANIATNSV